MLHLRRLNILEILLRGLRIQGVRPAKVDRELLDEVALWIVLVLNAVRLHQFPICRYARRSDARVCFSEDVFE